MMSFDKHTAIRCFEENPPSAEGKPVAAYWLSLWGGDALPRRADFSPKAIARALPAIAIFDVVPDRSVHCRLMGSWLTQGIGQDVTGQDWIALTEPEDRAMRLQRWSDMARGGVGRGLRASFRESGAPQYSEELMFPFAAMEGNEVRQVLYHISWKQTAYDPTKVGVEAANRLTREFHLTDLRK